MRDSTIRGENYDERLRVRVQPHAQLPLRKGSRQLQWRVLQHLQLLPLELLLHRRRFHQQPPQLLLRLGHGHPRHQRQERIQPHDPQR